MKKLFQLIVLLVITINIAIGAPVRWERSLSIGDALLDSSSLFDVISTTKGSRPAPVMSNTQKGAIPSPAQGLLIFNSTSKELNLYNNTTWTILANTDQVQTFTNKTIVGTANSISGLRHGTEVDNASSGVHGVTGTIIGTTDTQSVSNKSVLDALSYAKISIPASPASGYVKLYAKSDDRFYKLDSSGNEKSIYPAFTPSSGAMFYSNGTPDAFALTAIGTPGQFLKSNGNGTPSWDTPQGSGGGAASSLITNFGAEVDTTGWATYVDAAAVTPVDGTGGAPSSTLARNTTTPLTGTGDFQWTKSAANRQGEGFSYDFTMSKSLYAKNVQISFDYTVTSGTYADGDMIVYIYDVTNATLIEPVNISIASVAAGLPNKHIATFQSSLTGTSYRLIFHTSSTSSSAYTMQFDNVYVGEQVSSYGPIITDWKSFTPTGSWVTNTTYTGYYRRVGDTLEVQTKISLSGAPNAAALTINLPSGLTIDTAKLASNSGTSTDSFGKIYYFDSGVSSYIGELAYSSITSVGARYLDDSGTNIAVPADISSTAPHTWGASDFLVARYSVPIVGWSSNVALSSDAGDGREVVVSAVGATATVTGTLSDLTWTTTSKDNTGSFNGTTFTAPVSGEYRVSAQVRVNDSTPYGSNQAASISILKNGTEIVTAQQRSASGFTALIPIISYRVTLIKGDTVKLQISANSTAPTMQTGDIYNFLAIEKINPGSQRLAASETVAARYEHIAGQSIPNATNTIVDFASKSFDTHNAVTTGSSWKFTAPVSGIYQVSGYITYDWNTFTAGERLGLILSKNGTIISFLSLDYKVQVAGSFRPSCGGIDTIRLIAGDTIALEARQDEGGARSLEPSSGNRNYVSIVRIGNY